MRATRAGSLWLARERGAMWPPVEELFDVDVAVVGGGIVGTTAAMLLAAEGRSVALLEARELGSGATGASNAECTIHHGTSYSSLIDQVGAADARLLVSADRAALDLIRHWAPRLGIPHAARPAWSWAWTASPHGRRRLARERHVAASLGVATRWAEPGEVPWGRDALGVPGQLLVEPFELVDAFARRAHTVGARVHEHTRVLDVTPVDDGVELLLDEGVRIRARTAIVATQVPIVDRALVFAACDFRSWHVVALEVPDALELAPDIYVGIDDDALVIRAARDVDGTQLLVVSGPDHGLDEPEDGSHVDQLVEHARRVTGAGALRRAWRAHDAFPVDGRPFVGPVRGAPGIHVATGFAGWGLARGVAAAMSISAHVLRGHARWHHPLDAGRLGPHRAGSAPRSGRTRPAVGGSNRLERASIEQHANVDLLCPGEGAIVHVGSRVLGVACNGDEEIHVVDATCTHMGCIVEHDAAQQCWQCPCHGSRFALDGRVLNGPATTPLVQLDPARLGFAREASPLRVTRPGRGS